MNCLKHIRETARVEPNVDKRYMLQGAAGVLAEALANLCADPSVENMQQANGAWAYCTRVLSLATPPVPPTGNAGAGTPAKPSYLTAKAA